MSTSTTLLALLHRTAAMENAEMDEADAMRAILLEFLAEDIFTSQAEPPTEPAVQPHVSGQEQQHGGGGAAASDQLSLVEAEEEEQPNGRPAAPAAARRQRKRGLTSQQKVSLLQKRIAEQTAMLQRLSLDNVWATQRVRMLELVRGSTRPLLQALPALGGA